MQLVLIFGFAILGLVFSQFGYGMFGFGVGAFIASKYRLGVHGDFVGVRDLPVGPIDENIVSGGRSGRIGCRGHMSPFSVEGRPPDSPMSESPILHSDSSVKRKTPSGKK